MCLESERDMVTVGLLLVAVLVVPSGSECVPRGAYLNTSHQVIITAANAY